MLHATELLGGEAYDAQGNFVGRVSELFIEPADQPNRVARYLLGPGQIPAAAGAARSGLLCGAGVIKLNVEEKDLEHFHRQRGAGWRCARICWTSRSSIRGGRKVVRVNDVDLAEQRTDGTVELRVTDVDVGLTGAARRLLQGWLRRRDPAHPGRACRRGPIRWEFVNLIEPDPLRRVKLRITHDKLEKMHPADLADIMEELSPAERQAIIASLDEQTAAEALAELDSRLTSQIVEKMAPEKAADILEEMDPDKAADVLADLSPEVSEDVLGELPGEEAREVQALLSYDGRLGRRHDEYGVRLRGRNGHAGRSCWSGCASARTSTSRTGHDLSDRRRRQVLRRCCRGAGCCWPRTTQRWRELKSEPLVSVPPDATEKEVFELFDKYNLRSLARRGCDTGAPSGAIAVDDVVTRLREKL